MSDASRIRGSNQRRLIAAAAVASGEIWQLPDGRAATKTGLNAAAANDSVNFETEGVYTVPKTTGIVFLDGQDVWWDYSANAAHYKKVNDRDFFLGNAVGDAASAATEMAVAFNVRNMPDIDLLEDPVLSVATGTQALGGFLPPQVYGGARALTLTATNEAQCVDMLSVDRFAIGANAIADFDIRIAANGSTNAVDLSIGLANGTSTTDADAITEHVLFHIDGNDLSVWVQSKDGTTTVAAADSTVDITAGSAVANRFRLTIDTRDPADVQCYINGVLVLGATVFTLGAATGPLGLLVHLEKSSSTATAGPVYIDRATVRYMEQ